MAKLRDHEKGWPDSQQGNKNSTDPNSHINGIANLQPRGLQASEDGLILMISASGTETMSSIHSNLAAFQKLLCTQMRHIQVRMRSKSLRHKDEVQQLTMRAVVAPNIFDCTGTNVLFPNRNWRPQSMINETLRCSGGARRLP